MGAKPRIRRIAPLVAIALVATGLSVAPSQAGETPRCGSRRATIVGTNGNDRLVGTPRADVIHSLGGRDKVKGLEGSDRICGGGDTDILRGGPGNDRIVDYQTESGCFTCPKAWQYGGPGNDVLLGVVARGNASGGPGDDRIVASNVFDGAGDDEVTVGFDLVAGPGDDAFESHRDSVLTVLYYRNSPNRIVVDGSRGLVKGFGRDTFTGIGEVVGTKYDDTFVGSDVRESYMGAGGEDKFYMRGGIDFVNGGEGADFIAGGQGGDYLTGWDGRDRILGQSGDDEITAGLGIDRAWGGPGRDRMSNASGSGTQWGGAGDDALFGGLDHDVLYGEDGNDHLGGGSADDDLFGGEGLDVASFASSLPQAQGKGVNASLLTETSSGPGHGTDTLDSVEGLTGTPWGDTLEGDASPNVLNGNGAQGAEGEDLLKGNAGDDLFFGESWGTDPEQFSVEDGDGSDWFSYEIDSAEPSVATAEFAENLIAGTGTHELHGDQIVVGSLGDDSLYGEEGGNNILIGRAGIDSCFEGERIHGCETADEGTAYYQEGDVAPQACELAIIYRVPGFGDAFGLRDFCAGFD